MTYIPQESLPATHTRIASVGIDRPVDKGNLNKLIVRPVSVSEEQESSREIQSTVTTDKIGHGIVAGIFVLAETITGTTSGATGVITRLEVGFMEFTPSAGTFQVGEIITGGTSAATTVSNKVTAFNLVGQVFRMNQGDNIESIQLTLETVSAEHVLDKFEELDNAGLQAMWINATVPPILSTAIKSEGNSAITLDGNLGFGIATTHAVSFIEYTALTGNFTIGETITGAGTLTSAVIGSIDVFKGVLRVTNIVGTFSVETITGASSGATATSTVLKTAEDWSDHANIEFDMRIDFKQNDQKIDFTITDGTNTATVTQTNGSLAVFEKKNISLPFISALGAPAAVDLTAITSYSLTTSGKAKAGYVTYIDNLHLGGFFGNVSASLYDMGATLPISGTTTISSGTNLPLGSRFGAPVALINIVLEAGKKAYHVQDFLYGAEGDHPQNALLTVGNYYLWVLTYKDADVNVYGADTTLGVDYYTDGYAFSSPALASPITTLGAKKDCMFILASCVEASLIGVEIETNANMNGAPVMINAENSNMQIAQLVHRHILSNSVVFDFDKKPVTIPKTGKIEVYYTDQEESDVTMISLGIKYSYKDIDRFV